MYNNGGSQADWAPFASLILEASYEATLWAAVLHALKHKDDPKARVVLLTQLGGGVFGNDYDWIASAIEKAFIKIREANIALDIKNVCYGGVGSTFEELVEKYDN